jgi:hypothetical protein
MCTHPWLAAGVLVILTVTSSGCQGTGSRQIVTPEPGLSGALESNPSVVEGAPAKSVTYVDRHPLLSKPRDYWETSGDNKIVKAAAATFIGVPAGIFGEVKQIVVGTPPQTR